MKEIYVSPAFQVLEFALESDFAGGASNKGAGNESYDYNVFDFSSEGE